jgi:tRNA modification GTPase
LPPSASEPLARPTKIACLTPPGAGAIATLAIRGPEAWSVVRSLFRPNLVLQPSPGTLLFGRLGEEGQAADQVVLAVKSDGLEIHCHGGVEVVSFILEMFAARGVAPCTWQELSGELSPLKLLAQEQLLLAPTRTTATILLDQFQGAMERALTGIMERLRANDLAGADRLLSQLEQCSHLGRHLVEPFRIVIAGAPNVGKSSLINALAGYGRSLVSPIPGTTRDAICVRVALSGWPVELIDTAGLHVSEDPLEREGMARTRGALENADVRLWVLDRSAPPRLPPEDFTPDGWIINKSDLPAAWKDDSVPEGILVSALTGEGVTNLCQWLSRRLGVGEPLAPGTALAFTPYLADQISLARQAIVGQKQEEAMAILSNLCGVS